MTDEQRAETLWRSLTACLHLDRDVTLATVTHWLEQHGSGLPHVPLFEETVRDDAKFWAASAHQAELEAYLAACVLELERSALTTRAAKRLAAVAYKAMDAETQQKFREWLA